MSRTPREALREIRSRLVYLYGRTDGTFDPPALQEICGIAEDALAEPVRNCERYGGWMTALFAYNKTASVKWGDDVYDTSFLEWPWDFAKEGGAR